MSKVAILILTILVLSGCRKEADLPPRDHFEIGLLLPITGTASSAGESVQAGLTMGFEDINNYLRSTGSPLEATFTIRDTETDPERALQQLKDISKQGIRYVIGPYTSTNVSAVLDYANQNGIVLLSPSSVASSLAVANDNLFRLVPADGRQAEAISALFVHDSLAAVIPIVRDDVWGDGLIGDVRKLLDQQGVTVLNPIFYDPSNVNSSAIISDVSQSIDQALQQFRPSQIGVYVVSFNEGTVILEAAAGEPDCALVNWYGSSAFANNADLINNQTAAAFAMQQSLRCPSFAPEPSANDLWEPVSNQLISELGREPEVYALTAYDAVWLMTQVYAHCLDPSNLETFKAALKEEAKYHYGITGRLTFDEFGDRKHSSFNFWGLSLEADVYHWRSFAQFSNSGGLRLID